MSRIAYMTTECPAETCKQLIERGDAIAWADGEWMHKGCAPLSPRLNGGGFAEGSTPAELQPGETVCPVCWIVQPCGEDHR